MISVNNISKIIETGTALNMYPNKKFLSNHLNIIKPYRDEINLYKRSCYKELNTFFKTGQIVSQSGCPYIELNEVGVKLGKPGLPIPELIQLVAARLEELYDLVQPLTHDIIIYRGIANGTIGQNMFTGKCIKSRLFPIEQHRFCEPEDLEDIALFENRKIDESPEKFVYETLGFTSFSTNIDIAQEFSYNDTILALRLPAGTKFLLPVADDVEQEIILFPKQNTFILNNSVNFNKNIPVYVGAICNSINIFRPPNMPLLRQLKVEILDVSKWKDEMSTKKPILIGNQYICPQDCTTILHFCHPKTRKCVGDTEKNVNNIIEWWQENSVKGKCTPTKVHKCLDKYQACDPYSGECITDAVKYKTGDTYFELHNFVDTEYILAHQNPRYACDKNAIEKCAKESKLCDIDTGNCIRYNPDILWGMNNRPTKKELLKMAPVGKCTTDKITSCANHYAFCNPHDGICENFNEYTTDVWNDFLAGQTDEAKKSAKIIADKNKKFVKEKLKGAQKPRYTCTKEKIEQCMKNGQLCDPISSPTKCKDYTDAEDLYHVNNVINYTDSSKLTKYGNCSKKAILLCAQLGEFCNPDTTKISGCLEYKSENDAEIQKIHELLKMQSGKYGKMTVSELKSECAKRGIKCVGTKTDILEKLYNSYKI